MKIEIDGQYNLVLLKKPNDFIKINCLEDTEKIISNFNFVFINGLSDEEIFKIVKEWIDKYKSIHDFENQSCDTLPGAIIR